MASEVNQSEILKSGAISKSLRERIVSGALLPGARLPTRRVLEQQFSAGPVTVQRALNRLLKDGFVVAEGRRGTFVTQRPPHLFRYALAIPAERPESSLYFQALIKAAKRLERVRGCEIRAYLGVDGHTDVEDYRRLIADVNARRLAGIIFSLGPMWIGQSPLGEPESRQLGRVGMMGAPLPGVEALSTDQNSFVNRSLDLAVRAGRRRVGVFIAAHGEEYRNLAEKSFTSAVESRGMSIRPEWIQFINPDTAWTASRVVELMMNTTGPQDRPDFLVVAEDNLVGPVTKGLADAGVRVPHDVEVVGYANFPAPPETAFPVHFLGFDMSRMLELSLDRIDAQLRGEPAAPVTELPAVFASELAELKMTDRRNSLSHQDLGFTSLERARS